MFLLNNAGFVVSFSPDKVSLIKPWLTWNQLSINQANLELTAIFLPLPAIAEIKGVHHNPAFLTWCGLVFCFETGLT